MSDEPEAKMWDEGPSRYESRSRGAFYESAFASSEHLDRAPLLSEETYTDVPMTSASSMPDHCHWNPPAEPPSAIPQLLVALVLCAFFMICELIGGYLAGSLSVMCDAAHMLSDCGGFALALLAFHCAKRAPDSRMTYGYKRAEVVGAMVSVLLIWALTGVFVYVAALRLRSGDYSIEPDTMIVVAGCGVGFNIILAVVLHGCAADIAHHHSHGGAACSHNYAHSLAHSHAHSPAPPRRFRLFRRNEPKNGTAQNGALVNGDYTMKDLSVAEANVVGPQTRNINLRAALIHVIGDLIQSCGVLLASVLIKFYPAAKVVDPICTFVFSVLVLLTSIRVVRDALAIFMQAVPKHFRYEELSSLLSSVSGVRQIHSLHVWALSTHHIVVTAHVVIDDVCDPEAVLVGCQRAARGAGAAAATLQLERERERERAAPLVRACRACLPPQTQPAT